MRLVKDCEPNKRGCNYCADTVLKAPGGKHPRKFCIHNSCPYHELDNVKNYREYEKNQKNELEYLLKKLFALTDVE